MPASQTDLDQGGTFRQMELRYMGPSVGNVWAPKMSQLFIGAPGTYNIDPSSTRVVCTVSVANIILVLPSFTDLSPAITQPGLAAQAQSTIEVIDEAGGAATNPITIRASQFDNIDGLAQVQITSNYGVMAFVPAYPFNRTWVIR